MAENPPTNRIDDNAPGANMYGCQPCPRCGKRYRFPHQETATSPVVIQCDDCGFAEPLATDPSPEETRP